MMSVLINGRIKNKKKVEDFVYNTIFDLMPKLKRMDGTLELWKVRFVEMEVAPDML